MATPPPGPPRNGLPPGYAVSPEVANASGVSPATKASTPSRKTPKRPRGAKPSPRGSGTRKSPGSRYDSSLGLLTKKFTQLIQTSRNGIIDLNQAAEALGVQKRRIYDITNVLEGINLIEKKSKNNIQWKGTGGGSTVESQRELERLRHDLESLRRQDAELTSCLDSMSVVLKEMTSNHGDSGLAFITHEDARSLSCFQDNTVIAVKAPPGTTLEVPDPDEGQTEGQRRYQIFLNSEKGPIEVFLVSQVAYAQTDEPGRVASPSSRPASPHLAIGSAAGLAEEFAVTGNAPVGTTASPDSHSRGYVHERSAYHHQDARVGHQHQALAAGALGTTPRKFGVGGMGDDAGSGGGSSEGGAPATVPGASAAASASGHATGPATLSSPGVHLPAPPVGLPPDGSPSVMFDFSVDGTDSAMARRELGGLLPLYPTVNLEDELPPFAVQLEQGMGISDMFDDEFLDEDLPHVSEDAHGRLAVPGLPARHGHSGNGSAAGAGDNVGAGGGAAAQSSPSAKRKRTNSGAGEPSGVAQPTQQRKRQRQKAGDASASLSSGKARASKRR